MSEAISRFTVLMILVLPMLAACSSHSPKQAAGTWTIAIHGGAGTLERNAPPEQLAEYRAALAAALAAGRDRLAQGDSAVNVCEAVVRMLEDDHHFNAGKGAAFNEKGGHELDASIMDGSTLACGAVAGVKTVKNPISLARAVMEKTSHVLLMGDGAEEFATHVGVERVPNTYFDTEYRRKVLEEVLRERAAKQSMDSGGGGDGGGGDVKLTYSTVGCVVRDSHRRLAAATSTGGLTGKKFGRVGDSPIIGAGNYADAWVAVSGTGTGEEFIRHNVARTIGARVRFGGESLTHAADEVVFRTLKKDDGGIIAVDRDGNVAMPYSSDGMYRGVADSNGRFDVRIFEE
ncbi:MAG: isoaspartyl peptidase/L-asparaginase [Planctomycetota bacterium]|nr:isoaspartyl peptidase/L-asparaginase [Planctomycetota bacterium]